ncbi:MAG: FecR domain-containing protein [Pseudomonadota bacterium]
MRGLGTLFVSALAVASSAKSAPLARSGPFSGTITAAKGGENASLVPEQQWRPAEPSQRLKAGDILRTNANGTLAIVFADRTQMRLGRNTVLVVKAVSAGSPSAVALQSGRLWARAPRNGANLSIETPSATAAIRGTEWALSVSDDRTSLQVFDGKVNLANDQGAIDVVTGQAGVAERGKAPTRVVLADPVGREQILYFVRLEDGLDLLPSDDRRITRANALIREGRWAEARDLYRQADRDGSEQDRIVARFGGELALALTGEPSNPPSLVESEPSSYVARGFWLAYAGDLEGATATVVQGESRFPDHVALRLLDARIALLLGDGGRAASAIDTALARDPGNGTALALRAEVNARYRGQPWAALDDARAAVRADPARGQSYEILSDIYLERSAVKEAVATLEAAVVRDPLNPSLHARLASAYLRQNRVARAKAAIDRAMALDPTLSIVRTVLGQYHIQTGEPDAARDDMLAASSDNPGYAPALVQLAEMDYRLGDVGAALQQLDAADRLDPQSPLTPLARTAIAIHRYDADGAVAAARDALGRFAARGGVYTTLSENRTTGSYLSQAFRFIRMEEWARYYGDRVFDSFTPSSYFDQGLNFQVDPYVGNQLEPVGFDPDRGRDLNQLSSFMQGLALDPLAVTYPKRSVQFSDEAFTEASANIGFTRTRLQNRPIAFLTLDGLAHAPVPLAYSVTAGYRERQQRGGGVGADELQSTFLRGWLGASVGPSDNLVGFVNYEKADNDFDILPRQVRTDRHDLLALGFWTHNFAQREAATIGFGHGDRSADSLDRAAAASPGTGFDQANRFWFANASYMRGIGRVDLQTGIEATWSRAGHLGLTPAGQSQLATASRSRFRQQRAYLDARWSPYGAFIVQGQLAGVHSRYRSSGPRFVPIATLTPISRTTADYRVSASWSPLRDQWIRGGYFRQTSSDAPFTFAPTNAIGLRPAITPAFYGGRYDSIVAQWDAEWDPRVFTSIDYQRQSFDALLLSTALGTGEASFAGARLDRIRGAINILPGHNIGLAANYIWTDGRGAQQSGAAFSPRALPFVPRHLAQGTIAWSHVSRIRIQLRETWASAQRDFARNRRRAGFVSDVSILWEPLDKSVEAKLNIENIFATESTQRQAQGRIVAASLAWRF